MNSSYFLDSKMPKTKAVTHADLSPRRPSSALGSKTGLFLIVLTILSGLLCFILCLIAEATRSRVSWLSSSTDEDGKGGKYECIYSGGGKTPLLSAAGAFLELAIIMVVEHGYMLYAITNSPPSVMLTWEPHDSAAAKSLKWHSAIFFVATWICFAVGEILLLIGLSVESGHLKNWARPKPSCLVIREGVFSAAGVFALTTVFLAAGLYLTALRAQRFFPRPRKCKARGDRGRYTVCITTKVTSSHNHSKGSPFSEKARMMSHQYLCFKQILANTRNLWKEELTQI